MSETVSLISTGSTVGWEVYRDTLARQRRWEQGAHRRRRLPAFTLPDEVEEQPQRKDDPAPLAPARPSGRQGLLLDVRA